MEDTETNYTTNKTLMDYFKANIDVHINYLLFLNSFKGVSKNKGFMEMAPLIESLREKLYQSFAYDLIPDDTKKVNIMITKKLEELLDEINLSEVKEFIGLDIHEEDIVNLSTSLFLRRSINALPSINEENNSTEEKVISSTLSKMQSTTPTTDMDINGYSFELVSYFIESLRIKAEKNKSLLSYIYDFLSDAFIINSMATRVDANAHISCESDFLRKGLVESLIITSNFSLANLVDELNYNVKAISKKENKELTLEKPM